MDDAIRWSSVLFAPGTNTAISNGCPAPWCSMICKYMTGDCFCPCVTEQSQSSGQPPFLPQLLPDLKRTLLSGLLSAIYGPESNLCMRSGRKKTPQQLIYPSRSGSTWAGVHQGSWCFSRGSLWWRFPEKTVWDSQLWNIRNQLQSVKG